TAGIFPQIHIIQSDMRPPGADAAISPLARHTCFEVADYDAMKATLEREGIPYVENTQPGGRVQMLCHDPDGNTLEFQPATVCPPGPCRSSTHGPARLPRGSAGRSSARRIPGSSRAAASTATTCARPDRRTRASCARPTPTR